MNPVQTKDVRVRSEGDSFTDAMAKEDDGLMMDEPQRYPVDKKIPVEVVVRFRNAGPFVHVGPFESIRDTYRGSFSVVRGRFKPYATAEVHPKKVYDYATHKSNFVEDENGVVGEFEGKTSFDKNFIQNYNSIRVKI